MNRYIHSPAISYNAWSVSVFLMLFWGFHYTVLEILHITPVTILCIELFAVGVVALMTVKRALYHITPMFGWIIFFLLTLWNNYYIEKNALSRPVAMLLVIVLAYCLQFSCEWFKSLRQCITVFAWEHFAFSWLFYLVPSLYKQVIIPLFPAETRAVLYDYRAQNILMGFTDHYSISGIFFAIGCIAAFIYWLQDKKSVGKILFLVLMLGSLIMTQKRGPLVFAVCALVVIYFVSEGIHMRSAFAFVGGVGILTVVYFISAALYPALGTVFERFFNAENMSSGRDRLYEIVWELFEKKPIFGSGFGQYRGYSLNYYRTEYSAHNIYLQLMAEIGVFGVFVFVILLLSTLGLTVWLAAKKRNKENLEENFALLFSLGCQVYFITYGLTGNPIYDPQCFLPYFISIAIPFSILFRIKRAEKAV